MINSVSGRGGVRRGPGVLLCLGAAALAGCAGTDRGVTTLLNAGDFRAPAPGPETEGGTAQAVTPSANDRAVPGRNARPPRSVPPETLNVSASVGPPPAAAAPAGSSGEPVILDSLVGQINGKPVYASEFFRPLEDRLRALAGQHDEVGAWQRAASSVIGQHLRGTMNDELVLAESYASLSLEERQLGLLGFLENLRGNLVSLSAGSEALAEERLQGDEGRSLAGAAQDQLEGALVRREIDRNVTPRAVVTWRDVQLEYERNFDAYNPPPEAVLRMIVVRKGDAAGVEQVRGLLETGEPFERVAALPVNSYRADSGGLYPKTITGREYTAEPLFQQEELNEAAHRLTPGGTAGPVMLRENGSMVWVKLEEIRQPPGRSLEDVQVPLYTMLQQRRRDEETIRYLARVQERGGVPKERLQAMLESLLVIATERYYAKGT